MYNHNIKNGTLNFDQGWQWKKCPPPSLPQGGDDQNFSNKYYRFLYFRSKHLKKPTQKISGLYLVYKTMRQYDRKSYFLSMDVKDF